MFRTVTFALALSRLCLSSSARADDEDERLRITDGADHIRLRWQNAELSSASGNEGCFHQRLMLLAPLSLWCGCAWDLHFHAIGSGRRPAIWGSGAGAAHLPHAEPHPDFAVRNHVFHIERHTYPAASAMMTATRVS
jgi:hypothetical protein